MYEMGVEPETCDQDAWHRLFVEKPQRIHEPLVQLQWRARAVPSLATGPYLANTAKKILGVSGDGDTASIGMGQFVHLLRRNLPMIYIIEDNGVYG